MSFEVYLQCFDCGGPAGVPRDAIRQLFPVVEAESEPDYWLIRYDDRRWCHVSVTSLTSAPTLIESVCVIRPCADRRLWDALFAILQMGPVVLYFPGDAPPLVASEAAGSHLPAEMVEAMGRPCVICSGREIAEIINDA